MTVPLLVAAYVSGVLAFTVWLGSLATDPMEYVGAAIVALLWPLLVAVFVLLFVAEFLT